jgi:hypothetical protein
MKNCQITTRFSITAVIAAALLTVTVVTSLGMTEEADARVNSIDCGPNEDADICLAGGDGHTRGGGGGRTTIDLIQGGADITVQGGGGGSSDSDGNVGGGGGSSEFEGGTCDFEGGEGRHLQGEGDAGSEDNNC